MFVGRTKQASVLSGAAAAALISLAANKALADWSVMDKDIAQLESAYSDHETTAASVVDQYLTRIADYNKNGGGSGLYGGTLGYGGTGLNAVAQVNPNVMAQAATVDQMIASGATTAQYPLLGVPVLVKNSYDVAGLVTDNGVSVLDGSGTPGSTTLIPKTNSYAVQQLINEGAIIIGKASMSTMAYSYDGIDNASGVVENAYNPLRQPGGSSSGIGSGISAQFAMLGMGGETGGSIRVPSTYNDLVGLKTSAGLINPGGTWPLTPTRDVVGPIAKSVSDIAYAMNALVGASSSSGNLWSNTPYYPSSGPQPGAIGTGLGEGSDPTSEGLTSVTGTRPSDYTQFLNANSLQGKVIAVENDVVGTGTQYDGTIAPIVQSTFQTALNVLRAQGATIVYVNLPATVTYYNSIGKTSGATTVGFTTPSGTQIPYPTTTPGGTTPSSTYSSWAAAYYYEQQIESYGDPTIKNLDDFAAALKAGMGGVSGNKYSTLNSAYTNIAALAAIYDAGNAKGFPNNPDAIEALQAFTTLRQTEFDDFMNDPANFGVTGIDHIDAFVAPTMGNVAPYVTSSLRPAGTAADPYAAPTGTSYASLVGRFEGNILGLPSLTVPMGFAPDGTTTGAPMGIQFFAQLDSEAKLISYGYDYEISTDNRVDPNLTFVPEPASLGVILVLGGGMLGRRRRAV